MFKSLDKSKLLFTDKAIWMLLIPIMLEQLLNSFMGMVDTMMVGRVGDAAISAVSLVDSINVLVIQVFGALAAGATIICSQYIGRKEYEASNNAAKQVALTVLAISLVMTILCLIFCKPLLRLVFGRVEQDVMRDSITYFVITALSFPCIALFNAGSSFFRAGGESRFPMRVSVISNFLNIAGNALFIFAFNLGVAGAALATLMSRAFCMIVVFYRLRQNRQVIVLKDYFSIRPDFAIIAKILAVGIPSGIENGMFQFGKLVIQSSVSILGTAAIAAQALTIILENLNGIAGIGMGIGLMTIVGQCIGANEKEQAKYYIAKVSLWSWFVVLGSCLFVYAITEPCIRLTGLSPESSELCRNMMMWITIVKPIVWALSFVPGYGFRAAGDVQFSMIASSITMWLCRVALATFLIRVMGVGPIAVWIGMFADWTLRAIIFSRRYFSDRWLQKRVI